MENIEVWKPIKGYEGYYECSNLGRVKIIKDGKNKICKTESLYTDIYYFVNLTKDGNPRKKSVHRIIIETFLPNPNFYPYVNHIDGNKQNNRLENLEWCTPKQNSDHAVENGLTNNRKKDKSFREESPFNQQLFSKCIKEKKESLNLTVRELAIHSGLTTATIFRMGRGHTPDIDTFIKTCKWLDKPLDYFKK